MTCSELVVWFAERHQQPSRLRTIRASLGHVDSLLDHLVQLKILTCRIDFVAQDKVYYLTKWKRYQGRMAA